MGIERAAWRANGSLPSQKLGFQGPSDFQNPE